MTVVTGESVVADTPVTLLYGFETDFDQAALVELLREIAQSAARGGTVTPVVRLMERDGNAPAKWLIVRASKYVHNEISELLSHEAVNTMIPKNP